MSDSYKQHWEDVFDTKKENEFSWYQDYPKISMDFVEALNLPLTANIIDIGGGDSHFVDALLDKGYRNIYVLDISANAINRAKKRLGERAEDVNWIVSDVTEFEPPVKFDFWHDRAAFHFLTNDHAINKYVAIAAGSIKNKGYLVVGTFSENGPDRCSGLEIKKYAESSIADRFEIAFDRIKCLKEQHITPINTIQDFMFCSFRRK